MKIENEKTFMKKLLTQLNIRWKIFVTFKRLTHMHSMMFHDIRNQEKILHRKAFQLLAMFS